MSLSAMTAGATAVSASGQALRDSAIPKEYRIPSVEQSVLDVTDLPARYLSSQELAITDLDATALAEKLGQGKLKAVDVANAFFRRAAIAQETTNCLTEIFFEEGMDRAKELDSIFEQTGQPVGPLHGVPVSIKDHILVKGHDTSSSYISFVGKRIAKQDAHVVQILRDAGAIIYTKTANAQCLLSLETDNNIFGRTPTPYNRTLSAGGSSGGEAALIAMKGSPLGVGTDIGGSIRSPAACTGIYGLKGSVARMPHAGLEGSQAGMEAIVGAVGPMSNSARDLELFCRVMLASEPWLKEPHLIEIPWKEQVFHSGRDRKLKIAVMWDDGVVTPHPPITRALQNVKAKLEAAGHEVINWEPFQHRRAWDIYRKLIFLDGGDEFRQTLDEGGEPPIGPIRYFLDHYAPPPMSVAETWKVNVERDAFKTEFLAHWQTRGANADAILCPVQPSLAWRENTSRWWSYTSFWNLTDLPGVVFPVGRYKAADHAGDEFERPSMGDMDDYYRGGWDPRAYDNAPIALQLVSRRLCEEKLLGILHQVEEAIRNS